MGKVDYSTLSSRGKEDFVKGAGRLELLEIARDLMDSIYWIHFEVQKYESCHTFSEARAYVFADWMYGTRRVVGTESIDVIEKALRYCFPDLVETDIRALVKWERKRRRTYAKARKKPVERVIFLVSRSLLNKSSNRSRSRRSPVRSAAKAGDDGGEDSDGSDSDLPPWRWLLSNTHRLTLLMGGVAR